MMRAQSASSGVQLPTGWVPSPRARPGLSFLGLPKELRDMIYELAFELEGVFSVKPGQSSAWPVTITDGYPVCWREVKAQRAPGVTATLLRACKQTYSETRLAIYNNEFYFLWRVPCFEKTIISTYNRRIWLDERFPLLSHPSLRKVAICSRPSPLLHYPGRLTGSPQSEVVWRLWVQVAYAACLLAPGLKELKLVLHYDESRLCFEQWPYLFRTASQPNHLRESDLAVSLQQWLKPREPMARVALPILQVHISCKVCRHPRCPFCSLYSFDATLLNAAIKAIDLHAFD